MSLVKSSIGVSIISLFISIVSFINQIIIANYFGAGKSLDIYLLASSVPLMISGLVSSALSFSLIPHLIKMQIKLGIDYKLYLGQFFRRCLLYSFSLSILGSLIFFIGIPYLYTSLKNEEITIARIISIISWISIIPAIILSIISSSLNARKSFYFPLILNFAPFLFTIILTASFHRFIGSATIALGVLFGTITGMIIGLKKIYPDIIWSSKSKNFIKSIDSYIFYLRYAIIAMLTFTIFQSIDAFWAIKLGQSNLSYLGYSQRLLIAFGALIIAGPSTVLIPRLTEAIQENREDDFLEDSVHLIKLIISLASVIAVIGSVLAEPLIKIMFQRGAFNSIDTSNLSKLLPYMLIGMVFMLNVVVLFRALFVKEKGIGVAFIGIICALLYFIFSGIFSHFFSIKGITFAYMLTWIFIFFVTVNSVFIKNLKKIYNLDLVRFILKQAIILIFIYFCMSYMST